MIEPINAVNVQTGERVYRIPVRQRPGCYATVCQAGMDFIKARGVRSLYLCFDGSRQRGYVHCYDPTVPGETNSFARLLLGLGRGQRVRYLDSDPLNLCLSNLWVERVATKERRK